LVKWKTGNILKAIDDLYVAIKMLKPRGDEYGMADFYNQLGTIYYEQGDLKKAAQNLGIGVKMAKAVDLKEQVRDASRMLSNIYRDQNQTDTAYHYLHQYLAMRDSIASEEIARELANQRADFEIGLKQAEVDVLEAKRKNQRIVIWSMIGFASILLFLILLVYRFYQSKTRTNKILREQGSLLKSQKEELERLNGTKDKFFSIISHDLRGPVNSFMGVSRMIRHFVKSKNTDQLIGIADEMETSVSRLSNLLDNLLNWAMQQQGHFPNVPEKVRVTQVINGVMDTFSNMAAGKHIALTSNVEDDVEVWADSNMVQTIVRNLVNNALKFTPEEGTVALHSFIRENQAVIKISDTGVGIPKEKLDRLFRLYEKKSTYGTTGEKGLGLGLQLVHEFLDLNKGRIHVESVEGQGTTFTIFLPLFEAERVAEGLVG
ncbi:MAG: ATP-binding protein, partial [Bacteroidota bacterium]